MNGRMIIKCPFEKNYFCQLILLFNLFLLLFIGFIALFCTILADFYFYEFYLQHFQQKIFNFNKINRPQTNLKLVLSRVVKLNHFLKNILLHNCNVYISNFLNLKMKTCNPFKSLLKKGE